MKPWFLTAMLMVFVACDENVVDHNGDLAAPTGRVSQHGLYRLVRSGGLVDNQHTSTGKTVSNAVIQLVRQTDRIPLIKGAHMSLQFRLWYFPDQPAYVDLRRVLKHPEMRLPDGKVSTGSDYMMKGKVSVNQVIAYTGYGFDEEYELLEGEWIFEIWHEDRKLVEQKFITYRPDDEEIAALAPIFEPDSPDPVTDHPFSNRNWPRIVAEEADAISGTNQETEKSTVK
jgi:hypothetical protein